jgi:ABC-2 type transport system ATP-binding protein
VLILDEPTIGLDPAQIVEIRGLVKSLAGEHTIVFSTHILPEVTSTCSRVVIINSGRAVMSGPLSELGVGQQEGQSLHLQVARDGSGISEELLRIAGVRSVRPDGSRSGSYQLSIDASTDVRERVAGRIVERGWGLLEMTPVAPSLEEIYLSLTGGEADRPAA